MICHGLPLVDHVVSTKLSEDDLAKLQDACKRHQCTASKLIKFAITKWIESEDGKKEDLPLELKSVPHNPVFEEKVVVVEHKETTIDEAYFQYFRYRIDCGKCVKPH